MATVAESLLITLGLDTKGVKKGAQETEQNLKAVENQANKTGKGLEATAKQSKEMFSGMVAGVTSLVAAIAAAKVVKDFFRDAVTGMAELGRKSEYLHMSAAQLQGWQGVAESVGGTAADAGSSLQALAQDFVNLKVTGQSSFAPVLNRLGIDMRRFKDSADPLSDTVLAVADKLKSLGPQEALFFGRKLGFSDSFITALRQGRANVQDLLDKFRKASGATDENTKAAQRAQVAWTLLRARFTGIRDEVEGRLTPVVQKLLERLADWVDKNRDLITSRLIEWVQRFANWLASINWDKVGDGATKLLKSVMGLVSWLGKGVDALGGWKNVLIGFGAILSLNMLSPLGSMVGTLTRLVPLLTSARAGILGLTAAAAYYVGSKISDKLEGTKAGDMIGSGVAHVMAALGSDTAQQALEANLYSQGSAQDQGQLKAAYLMMSGKQKEQYEKDHPALAGMVKAGLAAQSMETSSTNRSYYAQHSRIYGDPKALFADLEQRKGLPKGLLNAIYQQESGGGKNLISKAGAKGPFQMMDATARQYGLSGEDVFDLDKEAAASANMLSDLMKQFKGNLPQAIAAYNAGAGNVRKYGGIPPFAETQKYVPSVLDRLPAGSYGGGMTDNSRSSEVRIGSINVNAPQATDARGIANALPAELKRNNIIAQATTGLH